MQLIISPDRKSGEIFLFQKPEETERDSAEDPSHSG